jgi:hypothetical protein
MIGGVEESEGVESESIDAATEKEPILMVAKDLEMANRLDVLNLKVIRWMIGLALLMVVIDYLKRANVYQEAYRPLPLPSRWINGVTPLAAVMERPEPARRSVPEELDWLNRRGDSFVYITDDASRLNGFPESLPRLGKRLFPSEIIRVNEGDKQITDDFVFDAAWFRRASFVVGSPSRIEPLLKRFIVLLKERRTTRARVRQTVHLVWDSSRPMPAPLRRELTELGGAAGFSLFFTQSCQVNS